MSGRYVNANLVRLLLPAGGLSIAFVVLFAIPLHRERCQVSNAIQQQSAEIDDLRLRLKTQRAETLRLHGESNTSSTSRQVASTVPDFDVLERSEPTAVQAFAGIISTFQAHDVHCTAANPENVQRAQNATDMVTYRVSFTGGFHNVLAALNSIEEKLPSVSAVEFSMRRDTSSEACRWEMAFRRWEASR